VLASRRHFLLCWDAEMNRRRRMREEDEEEEDEEKR